MSPIKKEKKEGKKKEKRRKKEGKKKGKIGNEEGREKKKQIYAQFRIKALIFH